MAAVFLRWGAGAARQVLLRPVPWNRWVVIHAWASLAAETGGAWPGEAGSAGGPRSGESGSVRRFFGLGLVTLRADVAAVELAPETRVLVFLPAAVTVPGTGGLTVTIHAVGRDGTVSLAVDGEQRYSLAPGRGLDWALVPRTPAGVWAAESGPWRQTIVDRLSSGLPVGRLSLVNDGLRRKSAGAAWPCVGTDPFAMTVSPCQ